MKKLVTSPLTDYMFYKAGKLGLPFSGTFELTPLCNFHCRMCYVRKTIEEVKVCNRQMRTVEQWLELAREAQNAGMLYLLLTGGEPTIYPGFWELYEKLSYMGLLISINTNGSMIDEKATEILLKRPPRKINITLYGASDETYEKLCGIRQVFSKIDTAISRLKESGIQVKLNCSLTPWNADELEAMVRYAKAKELVLDVTSYMFPPLRRNENMIGKNQRFEPEESAFYRMKTYCLQYGEVEYKKYLHRLIEGSAIPLGLEEDCIDLQDGQLRCRAGKSSFWVTWDGWMTLCGMMIEPKIEMTNRSFRECWEELKEVSGELILSGICERCENQLICHSCAAMAQTETGSFSKVPVYLCQMVKEMKRLAKIELAEIDT